MKLKVSAIVNHQEIGDALSALAPFASEVIVSEQQSQAPVPAYMTGRQPAVLKGKTKLKRSKRGPYKKRQKREVRDGSITKQAIGLVQSSGHKFSLKEIRERAKKEGVSDTNVFRAIKLELAAGHIEKLAPGQYQRKGSSFSQSMGLGS